MKFRFAAALPLTLAALLVTGCSGGEASDDVTAPEEAHAGEEGGHTEGEVDLTAEQIRSAG